MRKKLIGLLAALVSVCALFAAVACSGKVKVTPSKQDYDIGTGGDLVVTVELDGGKITRIKDGETVVDPTEYLFEEESSTLTIFESYMLYIDQGEHTFTLLTEDAEATFTVNVVNNVVTTFDTTDKQYEYASGADLVIDADLSTADIVSVKAGTRKLTANDYTYDSAAKKFTVHAAYCQTLYGTTEFTVSLSSNTEYKFKVISDCLFAANFDDDSVPVFFNENPGITADGWNGTRALHWYGNGGNLMLFYAGTYTYGMKVDFDADKIYKLTFQFKNNWTDDGTPEGFVGMNANDANIFYMDYFTQEVDGGIATCDADGVWSVTIYFYGCPENKFTNLYTGYDPNNPDKKLFDLLFDNIVLVEAEDRDPVMADTEKSVSKGSAEGDLWFDGEFGLSEVVSVQTNGAALSEEDYTVKASSIVLSQAYVNSLTETTEFVASFENGKEVTFRVVMGKSQPSEFEADRDKIYEYGSGDLVFDVNFRGFAIAEVKAGGAIVPQTAYALEGNSFIMRQSYLDTLEGKTDFVLTLDNDGQVEGVEGAEQHAFSVTSNAIANIRFEGIDALANAPYAALIGVVSPTTNAIEDGIDGKSWRVAATGGNFMAIKGASAAWEYGAYEVPMVAGTIYELKFDIRLNSQEKVGGSAEFIKFAVHTPSKVYGFSFDQNKQLIPEAADGFTIADRGDGVYTLTCRFTYDTVSDSGCVRLEAMYYNEINYDISLDNIIIVEVPMATSATYVYGSNRDVTYNVAFEAVETITANGATLTAEQYAIENGKLIIRAAYAQTLTGTTEIVASLAGGGTESFLLKSTRLQFVDFEGAFDEGMMARDIMTATKNEVVENGIDGKSWNVAATGGNFITFAPSTSNWVANQKFPAAVTDFVAGSTYVFSFDIKLVSQNKTGTQDAPEVQFNFILHGTDHDAAMYFDKSTNELKIDSSRPDRLTIEGGENGVYHVTFEFVYVPSGHDGCVRMEADMYQAVDYEILLDNIEILQKV